jgi:hypothetical protein
MSSSITGSADGVSWVPVPARALDHELDGRRTAGGFERIQLHGDEMYFVVAAGIRQPAGTSHPDAAPVRRVGRPVWSPTAVQSLPALEMGLIVILIA